MRHLIIGAILALACVAPALADEPQKEVLDRVTKSLLDADPLAEGSVSELLIEPDASTRLAIWAVAFGEGTPEIARERALRLTIADNRMQRVADNAPARDHSLYWWLALDEIDREIPRGPREALLAHALPDVAQREASLIAIAAGREVAARFCREWNEVQSEAEAKKYADLRAELEKAGHTAIPYLATILAVPPQAAFTVTDEAKGITARQQVRALWGLEILRATMCTPYIVFHVRGPSFTACETARAVLHRLGRVAYPEGGDEAAQLAAIDAWWRKDWGGSWERDHLVRHTIRWAREALASGDLERQEMAQYGPLQLEAIVGKLEYDPNAPLASRAAQLAAIERTAIRNCPACIK